MRGVPFTSDDIHPLIDNSEIEKIGYRKKS
jgi:hypothetical protein